MEKGHKTNYYNIRVKILGGQMIQTIVASSKAGMEAEAKANMIFTSFRTVQI
jgi:hypothetical protein